jgi:sugar/nucleoside kinase (ribokinase family)
MLMKNDVIGFGALNVDFIYEIAPFEKLYEMRSDTERGEEYPITLAEFNSLSEFLNQYGKLKAKSGGGQAANTISALSKIGLKTGLIGTVGMDDLGDFLITELKGINVTGIIRKGATGICVVILDEKRERTMFVLPNANDLIDYKDIDHSFLSSTEFLHLTSFVSDKPLSIQKEIVRKIPEFVKISFDPGVIYSKRGLAQLSEIIQRTFVLFLTTPELKYLAGSNNQDVIQGLLTKGPKIIVYKMGNRGSIVFTKSERYEIPAHKTDVLDSTGAGDVFAAGFLGGLVRGLSIMECGNFATKMAALSIKGYGRASYNFNNL